MLREKILRLLESATERDMVVFLISGGGSSMVEQMLSGAISLEEIAATHKALVESGAPIAAINAVRKHLSAVKGGGGAGGCCGSGAIDDFCVGRAGGTTGRACIRLDAAGSKYGGRCAALIAAEYGLQK